MEKKMDYETPQTKLVRVKMESGICTGSVTASKGNDVAKDRHVNIEKQTEGGTIDFGSDNSDGWN